MENREEVERICHEAVQNYNGLVHARSYEQDLRLLLDIQVQGVQFLERQAEEYNRQIRALGFHDIGHARTILQREDNHENVHNH
jgi:hypothetical protein